MAGPPVLYMEQNVDTSSRDSETYMHPDRELYFASAQREMDFRRHRMAPLSREELLLYVNVLKVESNDLSELNLATLNTLIRAHVERIPFQGIDAFVGHLPSLDDDSVFRKLIEQRRGGYCVELNNLFGRLLETLGFKFHIRAARTRWGRPLNTPLTPLGHMLFCVDLGDEGQYFADVGFGGPNPFKALPVEGEAAPYRTRRLDDEGNVEVAIKLTGSGSASATWRPIYHVFSPPQKYIDFVQTYWFVSLHPRSLFRHTLVVGRFVDDSWLTLVDGRFSRRFISGQVEQRRIADADELIGLLHTEFGLKLDPDIDIDLFRWRIKSII
ncbi:arylamine N-acetyltransferase-like [Rhipicephalus sanguineus]|uniref:arylamine N-acetyltransferase-like n=1 Tax=Rhipicephalus sanguineus TaxID=34632 RepID=UPI001894B0BD|nr:arylamine N-acetyltransferase-like [Rhipicephalus sanguineus]